MNNPFAAWSQALPQVDTPFTEKQFEVPPHSHGAQWGIVVTGRLHLSIDGNDAAYEPGETYDIGSGEEHSARLEAGTCVIDVFQDPDRYAPK